MERRIKTKVPLSEVVFDEEFYPRTQYYWKQGHIYSENMKAGAKFPPIVLALFNGRKILVDGKHRLEAHKLLKKKTIDAEVYTGWNKKKIFEEAIKRNLTHGMTLSPYERRNIALKMREMKYSSAQISELIQVPFDKLENFVAERMAWATTGEPIIVKSQIKHMTGQTFTNTKDVKDAQKSMHQNNQLDLIESLISLIQHKLIDRADEKIKARLKFLKKII